MEPSQDTLIRYEIADLYERAGMLTAELLVEIQTAELRTNNDRRKKNGNKYLGTLACVGVRALAWFSSEDAKCIVHYEPLTAGPFIVSPGAADLFYVTLRKPVPHKYIAGFVCDVWEVFLERAREKRLEIVEPDKILASAEARFRNSIQLNWEKFDKCGRGRSPRRVELLCIKKMVEFCDEQIIASKGTRVITEELFHVAATATRERMLKMLTKRPGRPIRVVAGLCVPKVL